MFYFLHVRCLFHGFRFRLSVVVGVIRFLYSFSRNGVIQVGEERAVDEGTETADVGQRWHRQRRSTPRLELGRRRQTFVAIRIKRLNYHIVAKNKADIFKHEICNF